MQCNPLAIKCTLRLLTDLCYNDVSGLTKAVTTIKTLILCGWVPGLNTDCTA